MTWDSAVEQLVAEAIHTVQRVYETDGGVTCPTCGKHWTGKALAADHATFDFKPAFRMYCTACGHEMELRVDRLFSRLAPRAEAGR